MKKALSILLIVVLLFTTVACGGSDTEPTPPDSGTPGTDTGEVTQEKPTTPRGELIIGNTTDLSGDWISTFQNNATDYEVLRFISGLNTVALTFEGEYTVDNTVVEDYKTVDNKDGSRTYTWNIKPGLKFSNGKEIKAEHYVANLLLWNSKFVADLGGDNTAAYRLVGHDAYSKGKSKTFEGVRLLGDYSFSMTIDQAYLPYFYELPIVDASPEFWDFWLGEGIEVKDDGKGAYFSKALTLDAYKETFEAARNNPKYVSSGPYTVENYDETTKSVVLKVNPEYPGDFQGQKPMIETVIFKRVTKDTQIDELATGQVDLLMKLVGGDEINAGFDLVDQGGFNYTDYSRAGYGKLTFQCDSGPTQFKEVRQAVAYLLDRNKFARNFTEGFGSIVNGPYGEGQWFFQENKVVLDEKLNAYPYSLADAVRVLEEGGWIYDEKGNDYKEGIRYKKMEDGTFMPLVIEWASSEQNAVSDLLVVELQENPDLAAAGIKINQTVMTFNELLSYYYRDSSQDAKYGVPTYQMFNLATDFNPVYDLTKNYSIKEEDIKMGLNTNFIKDKELSKLAETMVLNEPSDRNKFKSDFVSFVTKWNDLLPDIPLYSNIYHDFYSEKLQNYTNNSLIRMSQAVLYAYVTD